MNPPKVAIATPLIPKIVFATLTGSREEIDDKLVTPPSTVKAVIDEVVVSANPKSATNIPAINPVMGPFAIMPARKPEIKGDNMVAFPKKNIATNPTIIPSTNILIGKSIHI